MRVDVALKELKHLTASALVRFKRESRMPHELAHANLLRFYGLHEHEGRWFLAMELVDGTGLRGRQHPPHGKRTSDSTIQAAPDQIADGLLAVRGRGLVQRDLKTESILAIPTLVGAP